MSKTVVFGGTFDPPHIGHEHLLKTVMALGGFDRAIIVPTLHPVHKIREITLSFEVRCDMLKQMFHDQEGIEICDIENDSTVKHYTYNTMGRLGALYPNDKLYLLIGSDMFLTFERWYNFDKLLEQYNIVTAARSGNDKKLISQHAKLLKDKYKCKGISIYEIDVIDISSTDLRSTVVTDIINYDKQQLKPSRYKHVLRVAEYALKLAYIHAVPLEKAYVAALAHDCTKCWDDQKQLAYFEHNDIILSEDELNSPKIYHQISGAHFAGQYFKIKDVDILNSIRYHTTGRCGMNLLEKITFLADTLEPGRDFAGIGQMREAAKTDIDFAMYLTLKRQISYIKERGLNMNPQTLKAYEYYAERKESK